MLLDRYLMREIGASFAAVAVILLAIFCAYSLTRYLTDAASGLLAAVEVMRLTAYKALIALEVLLPLAFYFGVIAGCGRLQQHNELVVMRGCGMSVVRLARPLLVLALLLAASVAALSVGVRPWAYAQMFALKDMAESTSELNRIKPRRFYLYEDAARAVYVDHIETNGRDLRGVFIRTQTRDGLEVITAPRGRMTAFVTPTRHRLELEDAQVFKDDNRPPDVLARFGSLSLALEAEQPGGREHRTKSASTLQLVDASSPDERAELQWRLSTPVSTLLLACAALLLTEQRPRENRFARLPLAVGIYAVYYNVLGLNRTWVEQQIVHSLWWAPALLGVAITGVALARRRRWAR